MIYRPETNFSSAAVSLALTVRSLKASGKSTKIAGNDLRDCHATLDGCLADRV
jgi:hypothetical protein